MALFSRPRPPSPNLKRKEMPKDVWTKCPITNEMIYTKELIKNNMVSPRGYHFPLCAPERIALLADDESFIEYDQTIKTFDCLEFKGAVSYMDKLHNHQDKTGLDEAVIVGTAKVNGIAVSMAVMDFRFLGASMGSVVGERITRAIERGLSKKFPVIIVSASGGARMYEGILSLMQMAKTSAALARLAAAKIPFISVLTNPTMAGVMASFASLGDVIISEPGALIGFAGPRVIEETTRQKLPKGFQTAEFLLKHGLIDQIIDRNNLKDRIAFILRSFGHNK
ncbi:MAG: acetyl-CoA carboxylase, carboxyltransferase subunit beta [Puniceicoccales bacterium]|nr:acetyl-CoA carboxylase, carboxyltransferase subunit beta [Puniceicoccales bacterium]